MSGPRLLQSRADRALWAALVVMVLAVIGQQVWIQTRPHPGDVLDYPTQFVTSRLPGIDGPAVTLTGLVEVTGTKCNASGREVKLTGVMSWVSVDPPGTIIEISRGAGVRPAAPRCITKRFANPIPMSVQDSTRDLIAATPGLVCVRWQITGSEVPDNPMILPETWTTNPFLLCPPEAVKEKKSP